MNEINEIVVSKVGNEYTAKFREVDAIVQKGSSVESAIRNLITHSKSDEIVPNLSENLQVTRDLILAETEDWIEDILGRIRQGAKEQGFDSDRLPLWFQHARIRFGNQNHTIILAIEDVVETADDILRTQRKG